MRITEVEVLTVPFPGDAVMVVRVATDEGVEGLGEVGLRTRQEAVRGALAHLGRFVVGADPSRTVELWQRCWRGGFYPADGVVAAAVAALDTALWDIRGQVLGVSLTELLGGPVRDAVPVYVHLHPEGPETGPVVEDARRRVEQGWRHLRIAVPSWAPVLEPRAAMRLTVRRVWELRDAVGDDIELVIDAHTRLSMPEAVTLCREIEGARPYFVEDPLRSERPESYRGLRQRTGVPLAAGEQFASKWQFAPLVEEELVDHARVDLGIAGGVTEFVKIAAVCEVHGVAVSPHAALGPVGTAALTAVDAACVGLGLQEHGPDATAVFEAVFDGGVDAEDGCLRPPTGPGLGVTMDLRAARQLTATVAERPHLRRADGSFTNW